MANTKKDTMLANLMPRAKKPIPAPITTAKAPKIVIPEAAESTPSIQKEVEATKPVVKAPKKTAKAPEPLKPVEKARFNLVMDREIYIKFKQHLVTLPMNGSEYMEHLIMKDLKQKGLMK